MPVATVEQFWDLLSAARLQSADDITALRRDDSVTTSEQIARRLAPIPFHWRRFLNSQHEADKDIETSRDR